MEMVWMENKIKSFKNKIQVAFYKEKKTLKEKNFPSQCVFYHEKKKKFKILLKSTPQSLQPHCIVESFS
jgi:hypothetical protein